MEKFKVMIFLVMYDFRRVISEFEDKTQTIEYDPITSIQTGYNLLEILVCSFRYKVITF
jgi:hypothetical protein